MLGAAPFNVPAVVLAVLLVLAACHATKKEGSPDSLAPVAVRITALTDKARTSNEEVAGTVRPNLRAVIEAKVSGRIEKLLVAPGQQVKAGDLLAQLDARERVSAGAVTETQTAFSYTKIVA
jgi:multidrug efflux pump subunit AcrA (membrane-fusion protein)